MFSRFFIDRPIFSCVISMMILVAGIVAFVKLPVAQFPDIVPPVVVVTANYPGASPETLNETVAPEFSLVFDGRAPLLLYFPR